MKQEEIKSLLEEAANPDCPLARLNEIQCIFGEAIVAGRQKEIFHALLNALYVGAINNRQEHLPALFPIFAAICGGGERGVIIADVNWSLVG